MRRALTTLVWIALATLVLAPLAMTLLQALFPQALSQGSWRGALAPLRQLLTPNVARELVGTLELAAEVTAIAVVLGAALALLMVRAPPVGEAAVHGLLITPFLIPPYLTGLAWSLLAQPRGYLDQLVGPGLSAAARVLYSPLGIALVMALHLTPILYLALRTALDERQSELEFAARVHGASPLRAFRSVTLPLVMPALAAGGLLVFLASVEEYGVPAVLGAYANLHVLTLAVDRATSVYPVRLPHAAALSSLLWGLALVAWLLYRPLARPTGQPVRRARQPAARHLWSLLPSCGFILLATALPLGAIIATSLLKAQTAGLHAGNFSLEHYRAIFAQGSSGWLALRTSLLLSVGAAVLSTALAFAVAWVLRAGGRGSAVLDFVAALPTAMPGVVLAVALILVWNAPWNPVPLYGRAGILLISYTTLFLPQALRYAQIGFAGVHSDLELAGRIHGASGLVTLRRVTLPLVLPGLLAGSAIVFGFAMRELVTSIMLQPPGVQTISTFVFGQFEQGNPGDAMAMAVTGILTTTLLLGLFQRFEVRGDPLPAPSPTPMTSR